MTTRDLLPALAELAQAVTGDLDAEQLLRRLCVAADRAIETDGVGVMITEDAGNRYVHATTETVEPLERLQESLRTGPCRDAAESGEPVIAGDLHRHAHWPGYSEEAGRLGIGAAVAFPLVSRGRTWGVLDLYRHQVGEWADADLETGRLLTEVAAAYFAVAAERDAAHQTRLRLEHRTMHDELTGLPNRTLLFDRLEHALAGAARRHTTVAVFFIDLDRFKRVNDNFGHAAGDRVLVDTATRLASVLRAEDTLGRLSGDEFIWICEHLPDAGSADLPAAVLAVAARIRAAFAGPIVVDGIDIVLSASVGVAVADAGMTAAQLIAVADEAMYAANQALGSATAE